MHAKRPTLADVARHAGVSPTTASHILNGRNASRFSDDTRRRLDAAVAELDYRPNLSARSLRVAKTATIGFVSDNVATTRYASGMIRGALDAAARGHHVVLITETGGSTKEQKRAIEALMDRQVDGIVFGSMIAREIDIAVDSLSVPAVLLNCTAALPAPTVLPDEYNAGRAVARAVLDQGHRDHIALLGYSEELATDMRRSATIGRRFDGILDEFDLHGVSIERRIDEPLWVRDTGEATMKRLLSTGYRPSAIICMNDPMAFGAYQAIADHGLRVPHDISVVSFDDDEVASYLRPQLTTAALPYETMGKIAVEMIMGTHQMTDQLVDVPLLTRGSVSKIDH